MTYYINTDELYHYGIKGMKWYIRRFQNPDGTLTEAGKQRYSTLSESNKKRWDKVVTKDVSEKLMTVQAAVDTNAQKLIGYKKAKETSEKEYENAKKTLTSVRRILKNNWGVSSVSDSEVSQLIRAKQDADASNEEYNAAKNNFIESLAIYEKYIKNYDNQVENMISRNMEQKVSKLDKKRIGKYSESIEKKLEKLDLWDDPVFDKAYAPINEELWAIFVGK